MNIAFVHVTKGTRSVGVSRTLEVCGLDDPVRAAEWDRFVGTHAGATLFHARAWTRCLCETYGFRGGACLLRDATGDIVAVLPLVRVGGLLGPVRHVSLPFSDFAGILARDAEAEEQLLDGLTLMFNPRSTCLELRGITPERAGWIKRATYVRHVLDLRSGVEHVSKLLDRRTIQYSIRKAEKAGITIRAAISDDGLSQFYRLHRLTRAKHGVPTQPLRFFQMLMSGLAPEATPRILLALHEGTTIAAGFFVQFGRTQYFKYSAADPACLSSHTPNHLLTWHAIQAACELGLDQFDFGRSARANDGLCRYKRSWGAAESLLSYSYYPNEGRYGTSGEAGTAYDLVTSLWRRIPAFIQDRVGPRVYKYLA